MQAVAERSSASPNVLVFRTSMGTPAANPSEPPQDQGRSRHDPVVHGSKAAIAAAIFAGLAMIGTFTIAYINWSNRSDQKTQQEKTQGDAHINDLIAANPSVKGINENINQKFGELSKQIHDLDVRLARLEGPLTSRVEKLETRTNQQISLARIMDPARTLATIRAELRVAQASGRPLPVSDLTDYKNAIQALPTSAREYWTTAAAIINYQSLLNQLSGEAPDPSKISRPCGPFTQGTGENNMFVGTVRVRGCIVDLDSTNNAMTSLIVRDSVVRYHGGTVPIGAILFVNCAFILDLPPDKAPARPAFLYSLLGSPDLRTVKIDGM
jgi:hypothetical protein